MTRLFNIIGGGAELAATPAALVERSGGLHLLPSSSGTPPGQSLISPGWIDLHTHVYDGFTSLSVHPDIAGLQQGVTLVVDAGSAGEATIDGFPRYIVPAAKTTVRAFLNIGSHGLVHLREVADMGWIHIDLTLEAISRHRGFVRGVKVRSSGAIVGSMGLQPLQMARIVARDAGLPLMVHIGEPPPCTDDVLDHLGDGDIVTHCFHGKVGGPWTVDGCPTPPLRRALERGVLLDVGHGAASFSAIVAKKAIAAGWRPNSISTDLHIRNISGPVHGLAVTMSKMLALGMTLEEVVLAVTKAPGAVLGEGPWVDDQGLVRRATIFRVADHNPSVPVYRDAYGNTIAVSRHIVPEAVVIDGQLFECKRAPT